MGALPYYGIPIVLGIACGFFLSMPVNMVLIGVAFFVGLFALWRTSNWELGAILGVLVAWPCGVFIVTDVVVVVLLSAPTWSPNLSWMLR